MPQHNGLAGQTRTTPRFSFSPGTDAYRRGPHRAGVHAGAAESGFSFRARFGSGSCSPWGSLAAGHLYFSSAIRQLFVYHSFPLVSLVYWRRTRTGVGGFSTDALFFCRSDRHDGRCIFLRREIFQFNVVRVLVFRVCAVLSRSGDLHLVYPAGENQMARLGFSRLFAIWIFCEPKFLSHGAGGGIHELSDLFGPEIIYEARHRGEVSARRKRFAQQSRSEAEPLHKCAVCGATELSDPNLDFRVARDGEEYCMAHLPCAETPAR